MNITDYSQYEFDQRSPEESQRQAQEVKKVCDVNWKHFEPLFAEQLKKDEIEGEAYKKRNSVQRMDLSNGLFVNYSDNISFSNSFLLKDKCILALPGIPGSIKDFSPIERRLEPNFCRFIHLFLPGLDNNGERRGDYNGSLVHSSALIIEFLDKLKINKIIILMHSFGGYFGKYFSYSNPERVEALIQIASIPLTEWHGWKYMRMMFENVYQIDDDTSFEYLNSQKLRDQIQQNSDQFKKDLGTLSREQKRLLGGVLNFSTDDILSMKRITNSFPGGIFEILHKFRQIDRSIPRLIIYSPIDELAKCHLYEEEIYDLLWKHKRSIYQGPTKYPFSSDFQQNFVFRFDKASHYLHFEKASPISVLVNHFLLQLNSVKPLGNNIHSKL